MTNPVIHFEIGARDSATLREFYHRMFGWKFDTSDPNYSLVASTNGGIGGGIMQLQEDIPDYGTVYVGVPDLAAALARATEFGGGTVVPPTRSQASESSPCSATPKGTSSACCTPRLRKGSNHDDVVDNQGRHRWVRGPFLGAPRHAGCRT